MIEESLFSPTLAKNEEKFFFFFGWQASVLHMPHHIYLRATPFLVMVCGGEYIWTWRSHSEGY